MNFQFNPLSVNPKKWSNTLKQFVGKLPANFLRVFDHFVGLALKGLSLGYGYPKNRLPGFRLAQSFQVIVNSARIYFLHFKFLRHVFQSFANLEGGRRKQLSSDHVLEWT